MSTKTLRKRISLVAVTALTAGVLSVVAAPVASANIYNSSNAVATVSALNVATTSSSGNLTGGAVITADAASSSGYKSHALLYKDASSSTAQTATVLAGGTLVLYTLSHASTATNVGFTATGGSFGTTVYDSAGASGTVATGEWSADKRTLAVLSGTAIAVTWAAGTTAGTYTINSYLSTANAPSIDGLTTATNGTLFGGITVTVVAAAAASGPVAANSVCSTAAAATNAPSTLDNSSAYMNGYSAYVNLALADAYLAANSTDGNIVVSATNGALVNIGSTSSSSGTVAAGTGSTVVAYGKGSSGSYNSIRISQGTVGAPVTTTVSISFNGATICTKTVTIRGVPSSMAISSVSSVAPSGSESTASWLADGTGRSAHM